MTYPVSTNVPQSPSQTKKRALLAGWLCLLIGMFLMFVSLGTFFIYGPLFLAAFILSIIAMSQGRVAGGVILLLVTLAVPTVTWLGLVVFKVGSGIAKREEATKAALSAVTFEEVQGYIDGDYMYLKGKVRNAGSSTVDSVKVGVDWLDQAGTVLDTDYTYAVSGQGLEPGGAKSFEIMTRADLRMKKYRYYVVNK